MSPSAASVSVAGRGPAAVETMLALREPAGTRVRLPALGSTASAELAVLLGFHGVEFGGYAVRVDSDRLASR